jgi:hypothetical protein
MMRLDSIQMTKTFYMRHIREVIEVRGENGRSVTMEAGRQCVVQRTETRPACLQHSRHITNCSDRELD